MSFETILVGDNGSPDAERALAGALALGEKLNAKVILLGVLPPPSAESLAEGYGLTNLVEARKKLQAHRCWLFMMMVRTPAVPAPPPATPRATPTER